ncbi:1-phosphatidylinositol 4,5-bisphosphate phosphodiesterase delta-4 isoform X2 [Anabrus simplex]|uniref:1-phosphatidylinositol 4,5-bisphosphate phosphodiesterase delta-4 isoform X2 n=1 Tax=Anabrus simplex TaxID=316456 RepID=UPI0035A266FB
MDKPSDTDLTSEEAIDNRSKTIEEILVELRNGTILWKVRSFDSWYRRKYYLDDKSGTIRYDPSHKLLCVKETREIVVDDIVDVRKGWKTDIFNKIERRVEKRRIKFPTRPPAVIEDCCFSVIYGMKKQSLDLVAPNPKMADMWVHGLRHLVTVLKSLQQEERFKRWLLQQFQEADIDNDGNLNFEESLKLLNMLNVKITTKVARKIFEKANTNKNTKNDEQVLDSEEFVDFFMELMTRPEIKELFTRYSKNKDEMDVSELMEFIAREQRMPNITKEECLSLIEAFEMSKVKENNKISLMGFTDLLMSEHFEVFNQRHRIVYQDMCQPLSHYYIASSHNTYLTGGQLKGDSSVEGYINALKQGCRCVELDCWDGADGEPVVYHGYTLTTKILFKDILIDAIKPYAFFVSEYPVILSLENHCSEKQQEVLTQHMIQVFGDMLYTDPVDENMQALPSPESLKNKIIVKAKKQKPLENDENDSSSGDEQDCEMDQDSSVMTERKTVKQQVALGLSNLVNICQATHFRSFEYTQEHGKCFQMSSFSEAKAEKFIETKGAEFARYNMKHLSRIYPAGRRTGSSNFKPTQFWNVGCQLVALNYQHLWKPMFYNEAKFRQNGGCGYVLKPEFLRNPAMNYDPETTLGDRLQIMLKLTIISGQCIPKALGDSEEDIVDPYVKVKIVGHPRDIQSCKTEPIKDNGFNPRWNHEMVFNIKMPDLAMIHFIVKDESVSGKNDVLGSYALPFQSLQEGYRHVYLMDYNGSFVSPASLFIHASIIA